MNLSNWDVAHTIARELANRETDVNEFQKAITYARVQTTRPDARAGERFFALLDTMVRDGRYLMRSGRTMDYYRNLQEVCKHHLGQYQSATAEEGEHLVEILAWAARLMRYYNTDAGDAELVALQNQRTGSRPPVESRVKTPEEIADAKAAKKAKKKPKKPSPQVERASETVTLVTFSAGGRARVRTGCGEEIVCVNLPAYPIAPAGEVCDAEVTRENGRAVQAVFQRWK